MDPRDEHAILSQNSAKMRFLPEDAFVLTPLKDGGEDWFAANTLARFFGMPDDEFMTPYGTITWQGLRQAILRMEIRTGKPRRISRKKKRTT